MVNKLEKAVSTAADHKWDISLNSSSGKVNAVFRRDVARPDGYPHVIDAFFQEDTNAYVEGTVTSNYGLGDNSFPIGYLYLLKVLENPDNPFKYKAFLDSYRASDPLVYSEKEIAKDAGTSERQIRNARIFGFMKAELADLLSVKILQKHPIEVFGVQEWIDEARKDAPQRLPTSALAAQIIDLYESGLGLQAVGDELGISPSTVRNVLEKNDVPRRPRGRRWPQNKKVALNA